MVPYCMPRNVLYSFVDHGPGLSPKLYFLLPTGVKFCVQQQDNTSLSVGIAIKNSDIKDGIDKQTKKADKKGKWNNALKERIDK